MAGAHALCMAPPHWGGTWQRPPHGEGRLLGRRTEPIASSWEVKHPDSLCKTGAGEIQECERSFSEFVYQVLYPQINGLPSCSPDSVIEANCMNTLHQYDCMSQAGGRQQCLVKNVLCHVK